MAETNQITLEDKIKALKELDEQIVEIICASKEENVDEQVSKEIEESDEANAEFGRTLFEVEDALSKLGGQSMPLLTSAQVT